MGHFRTCGFALAAGLCALLWAEPAEAAPSCVHPWAVPGEYTISGPLRGRVQTATARLSNSCRVTFNLPGVFTGGPIERAGSCVRFHFKVRGEATVFTARWCNTYAIVPWNGRDVRVNVYQTPRQERGA